MREAECVGVDDRAVADASCDCVWDADDVAETVISLVAVGSIDLLGEEIRDIDWDIDRLDTVCPLRVKVFDSPRGEVDLELVAVAVRSALVGLGDDEIRDDIDRESE